MCKKRKKLLQMLLINYIILIIVPMATYSHLIIARMLTLGLFYFGDINEKDSDFS